MTKPQYHAVVSLTLTLQAISVGLLSSKQWLTTSAFGIGFVMMLIYCYWDAQVTEGFNAELKGGST